MSSPGITYTPCPDATPEAELSALSAAYKFILDSAKKNAADVTSTDFTSRSMLK